jgi:5-methylcytosine-specific restriction endonuclease McrA
VCVKQFVVFMIKTASELKKGLAGDICFGFSFHPRLRVSSRQLQRILHSISRQLTSSQNRRLIQPLIDREGGRCFYCLRSVNLESCVLDHVVPEAKVRDNSYRNIVVSCHPCNAVKQEQSADDFLRSFYRQGILSKGDLSERLAALSSLQSGHLLPKILGDSS